MPFSTKRREVYDLGVVGLKILKKDGPVAFLYRVRKRYEQKYFNASNIPIIETRIDLSSVRLSLAKKPLYGQFTSTSNNLNEIKIFTTTNQRRNSDIEFQITDTNGHIIRRLIIKGYKVLDNDYTSFKFKPIKDSKGRTFFFKLISKGEPGIAVWYNEEITLPELSLYFNNEPVKGSIGFQVFADLIIKSPYDLWIL
jgi:hypothetical protein